MIFRFSKKKPPKGKIIENLVSNFFDKTFSRLYTFPKPATQIGNAEVSDVLLWLKHNLVLIEVKTREEKLPITNLWMKSRINEAIDQLVKNYGRIVSKDQIKLFNRFYHTFLDYKYDFNVIGLIILDVEVKTTMYPSQFCPDIYKKDFPIHVLSWNDMKDISKEINTVPDFLYYLYDRNNYLKISDIPICKELEVVGYYKSNDNHFPLKSYSFLNSKNWHEYITKFSKKIENRNEHNQFSKWMDILENSFSKPRWLFDGEPIGLMIAMELGTLDRRVRAYFGEKLESVQDWFKEGKLSRRYAYQNPLTRNWLVFYFSTAEKNQIFTELRKEVQYKLMIEIEENSFDFGIYGYGFQVSKNYPHDLLGLKATIVIGADELKSKYSSDDLLEAYKHFGGKKYYRGHKIEEFPEKKHNIRK